MSRQEPPARVTSQGPSRRRLLTGVAIGALTVGGVGGLLFLEPDLDLERLEAASENTPTPTPEPPTPQRLTVDGSLSSTDEMTVNEAGDSLEAEGALYLDTTEAEDVVLPNEMPSGADCIPDGREQISWWDRPLFGTVTLHLIHEDPTYAHFEFLGGEVPGLDLEDEANLKITTPSHDGVVETDAAGNLHITFPAEPRYPWSGRPDGWQVHVNHGGSFADHCTESWYVAFEEEITVSIVVE